MKDGRKALKVEWTFAISEIKAGYVEFWRLFWATLVAPFKVCMEFATGKGRWAADHTVDPDTQLSSLGFESFPINKWLRKFGVGGSAYYRFLGMVSFFNSAVIALHLFIRVVGHFSPAR